MPALSLSKLRAVIGNKPLGPLYLLVGEDVRLVEQVVDQIEATIDPADRPFAVERVYAGDAGGAPLDIAASARVFPMLGDRRIVFVMRAERLLKPKRASRSAETDDEEEPDEGEAPADMGPLEDYLAGPVPSTTVVFVAAEIDKSRRLTKKLLEAAQVVTFGGLEGEGRSGRADTRAAAEWVRSELEQAQRAIDPVAVHLLVDRAGGDITKLRGDLERLLLYTEGRKRITRDDVAEVASIATQLDDWAVVNAIADGDAPRALREAAARLERGDSPHGLVGQLRWWVSQRLAEGAPERVAAALDALLRTDLALKSSGGEDRVLVERLVIDLTGRPLPRQRSGWSGR